MKDLLDQYLKNLTETSQRGDAREESYYKHLEELVKQYAEIKNIKMLYVTILPKEPKREILILGFGTAKIISPVTSRLRIRR